jgi:hypothetical protein
LPVALRLMKRSLDAFHSRAEHRIPLSSMAFSLYEKKVRDTKNARVVAAIVLARPDFAVTGDVPLR